MGRNHIHFAPDLPEGLKSESGSGSKVISGMRKDAHLLFYINLPAALAAGIPFWRSENEVILSEGDPTKDGLLGMEYVEKIVDVGSANLGVMWENGRGLIKELPPKLKAKGVPRGKGGVMKRINEGRAGRAERGQQRGGATQADEDAYDEA